MIEKGSVFVGTPTHICKRYCAREFCEASQKYLVGLYGCKHTIANNSKKSAKTFYGGYSGIDFVDVKFPESCYGQTDSIHKRITTTANWLREMFLATDCKWYLSLESDVIFNHDFLPRMLKHGVSVLHTNCYHGFNVSDVFGPTDRITMGCTLIARHVIESTAFRYSQTLLAAHYDALFAHDCNELGIPMFYDPEITPLHMEDRLPGRGWNNLPEEERGG